MKEKLRILSKGDVNIFIGNVLALAFVKTVLLQFLHLQFGDNSSLGVIVYGVLFVYLFGGILKYQLLRVKGIVIWLALLAFFMINYGFTNQVLKVYYFSIDMILTYIFYIPIAVFLIPQIRDVNKVLSQIALFRYVVLVIAVFMVFFSGYASNEHETYMSFSYAVMPFVLLCFYEACYRGKSFDYFAYILGVIIMVFYGARTPLVSSLVSAALMYMIYIRQHKKVSARIMIYLMILVIAFIIISSSNVILAWLGDFGESIGSYALSKLNQDAFLESAGRDSIYEGAIRLIRSKGGAPLGLFADRYYLDVIYVHNIFLEFLINFGVIVGGILSILLIYGIFRSFLVSKGESIKVFLIISFFAIFIRFLLSGSYLIEGMSFVYFAILMRFSHKTILV